ncbi:hypothetical protein LINPERHAP2_LOCUS4338 [Linum perenne]
MKMNRLSQFLRG